jgi:hypothetical protein
MSDVTTGVIGKRIQMAHTWIRQATEKLSEEELCQRFGPTAPPIGWHLWHIARWADRVQASLPRANADPNDPPNPNRGIWEREQLAQRWDLDPASLGTLEEGSGMDFEASAALPRRIGKEALFGYVQQVFAATDEAIANLRPRQFEEGRSSVMEYKYNSADGTIWRAEGAQTTLAADLAFHLSHANRHLGMMEALGGLLERKSSVTV